MEVILTTPTQYKIPALKIWKRLKKDDIKFERGWMNVDRIVSGLKDNWAKDTILTFFFKVKKCQNK